MTEAELEADRVSRLVADAEEEARESEQGIIVEFIRKFTERVNIAKSLQPQYWIWELAQAVEKGEYK